MTNLKKKNLFSFLTTLALSAHAAPYIVQKGDTLSSVSKQLYGDPIYGKNGSLKKLVGLNPQLKNINLIFPGDILNAEHVQTEVQQTSTPDPGPETLIPPPVITASDDDFEPKSLFKLGVGVDYFRVDATDKSTKDSATVLSRPSPRVTLSWNLFFNPEWSTEVLFSLRQEKISQDTTSARKLNKTNFNRLNMHFGVNRHWSDKNKTLVYVGRSERGFLRAISATELTLDAGTSTDVGVKHETIIYKKKTALAGLDVQAAYLSSAETPGYRTDPGYMVQGGGFIRHQLKSVLIEARAAYGVWKQDTKYSTHDGQEMSTQINLGWVFE